MRAGIAPAIVLTTCIAPARGLAIWQSLDAAEVLAVAELRGLSRTITLSAIATSSSVEGPPFEVMGIDN